MKAGALNPLFTSLAETLTSPHNSSSFPTLSEGELSLLPYIPRYIRNVILLHIVF